MLTLLTPSNEGSPKSFVVELEHIMTENELLEQPLAYQWNGGFYICGLFYAKKAEGLYEYMEGCHVI